MTDSAAEHLTSLDIEMPIWNRFYKVSSLVLIGARDKSGEYNLAPKHMAMPMGWENYFGFVCTPNHSTYQNILRDGVFTVTYLRPTQVIFASLAASPRTEDSFKPSLTSLPTFEAESIEGKFVSDGYAFLECKLHKIVNGFGKNSLITGAIVAARIHKEALRMSEVDDNQLMQKSPLMAYIDPDRFASIDSSFSFPLPKDFRR